MKLVQLTDTHLLADPARIYRGWNTWHSLEQVLAQIRTRHGDLGGLLATGDLVHDESVAGYTRLALALRRFGVPVFATPGNHDSPSRLQQVFRRHGLYTGLQHSLADWNILLLNTHWPGHTGGRLTGSQRVAADNVLRKQNRPTLLCMHHPPCDIGSPWLDSIGLHDRNSVSGWLRRYPQIRAVISGHVHQTFDSAEQGLRIITSPSTCRQFLPGAVRFAEHHVNPGYRILALHDNGVLTTWIERLCAR